MKSKHQMSYNTSDQDDLKDFEFYQDVLNDEKEIKMDFSFDDFTKLIEAKEIETKTDQPKSKQIMFWISSIAACSLLSLGVFNYFNSNSHNEAQNPVSIVNHPLDVSRFNFDLVNQEKSIIEKQNLVDEVAKFEEPIIHASKKVSNKTAISIQENIVQKSDGLENLKELVVVNGEEIEDPLQAQQIALDALKLFASNFSKGTEAIDNLKKISVEF